MQGAPYRPIKISKKLWHIYCIHQELLASEIYLNLFSLSDSQRTKKVQMELVVTTLTHGTLYWTVTCKEFIKKSDLPVDVI